MNQDISICVLTENEMGWTEPFELDKVQILDNYYLSAQKSDIAFLKKMDTARLLAGFRTTAGIDTKGVRPSLCRPLSYGSCTGGEGDW